MSELNPLTLKLEPRQFEQISELMYKVCGNNLREGKEELVKSRLTKRLRLLGLRDFDSYLAYLREDGTGEELSALVDSLTTNETHFFREPQHFEFLRRQVLPACQGQPTLRIWSAGCSSGEEPYSLAILLREQWPAAAAQPGRVRILATDISRPILQRAREGVYREEQLKALSEGQLRAHFSRVAGEVPAYRVREEVRSLICLARLNLMSEWPMRGPFDVIFCRNVMIYFDRSTQQHLVERFLDVLRPGGHLFVGHSESLAASVRRAQYVAPAVYQRP